MNLFLSASIPTLNRNSEFFKTVDVFAIKEAIRGLVSTLVEQDIKLVFGGHPAITPMIRIMLKNVGKTPREYITLYQSEYFISQHQLENENIEKIELISAVDNSRDKSLLKMRKSMIGENNYDCAIFIGGMEGVIEEFRMFQKIHPKLPTFPIASTGAAALQIYEELQLSCDILRSEYSYPIVFHHIFREVEKYNSESNCKKIS